MIKASGYDVIALNEVFATNAGLTFVAQLKATYPYYISLLEGPEFWNLPDSSSGLMHGRNNRRRSILQERDDLPSGR